MIIAFDVDETLTVYSPYRETPRYDIIQWFHWFKKRGDRIIIWSGGGEDYAKQWAEKLGLNADVYALKCKESAALYKPDITFDDEIVKLGTVNIRV